VTTPKRPSAAWYLLLLVPIALCAVLTVRWVSGMFSSIEAMPRVVVPGEGDVELSTGEHVAYIEASSVVDGVTYAAANVSVRCTLRSADTGESVALESSSTSSSYTFGSYHGQSAYQLTIPRAGTYHLACDGDGGPAALAIGGGIFGDILFFVLSLVGLILATVAIFVVIFVLRRRSQRVVAPPVLGTAGR